MMFAQCRLSGLLLVALRYWLTFPSTRRVPIYTGSHSLAADFDSLSALLLGCRVRKQGGRIFEDAKANGRQ